MKIYDFIMELANKVTIPQKDRDIAKNSKVTTNNNYSFKLLVDEYHNGFWDSDLPYLYTEVMILA